MNKSLSISEWHQLAQNGTKIPVRILLNGWSMEPLIRMDKDYITVVPLDKIPTIGDIVMFEDKNREQYITHRVWDVKDQEVLTWGDNCLNPDGWLPLDCVWGKIVQIERGKKKIQPNPEKGLRWARFWHHASKIYRPCIRWKNAIRSRIDKFRTWVKK